MQLLFQLRSWADHLLSFAYPNVCQLCDNEPATKAQAYVGEECRSRVRLIEPPFCSRCGRPFEGAINGSFECSTCLATSHAFFSARSAAAAEGPVLDAIHKYKYNRQLWLEPFLGGLLAAAASRELGTESWTSLVPVPLWPAKEREREFNQAHRLAHWLSKSTGIPVDKRLIRRILPTSSQTRLTRTQRAENMRGAFALRSEADLSGCQYIVIDDVFTTGATADACAKVLIKAGAAKVIVWTVARGL